MKQENRLRWALVTGASSGIGEAFARRFAKDGWNVVLVARSVDKLNNLARVLTAEHSIQTLVIGADLRLPTACRQIYDKVSASGICIDSLINNAGFGAVGTFVGIDLDRQLEMIDVNVRALAELTYFFLPLMIERKHGWVINVSSTASFQPIPYFAMYSATKAFVTSFSEALWAECRDAGVTVLNLCPGRTKTNFGVFANQKSNPNDLRPVQTAEEVVDLAFQAMSKRKPTVVTNLFDNFLRFFERIITRKAVVLISGKLAKRMGYR
ncbi:MAG: SDR family oxidoreductase [Candidatus Omnitrophica bacterium]|nr:SDR family oxidoreductase [Candidatus Omnitrophota bacterium]